MVKIISIEKEVNSFDEITLKTAITFKVDGNITLDAVLITPGIIESFKEAEVFVTTYLNIMQW